MLTAAERALLLNEAVALDPDLAAKLRFGVVEGKRLVFRFSEQDYEDLLDALASEANHASPRRLRRQFDALYERLSRIAPAYREPPGEPSEREPSFVVPPEIRRALERILENPAFQDADAANRELKKMTEAYNHKPQKGFQGLSPYQVSRLLYSDWVSESSAIRMNADIPPSELAHLEILRNTRILVHALAEGRGSKATVAGNLNRRFVREVLDAMQWLPGQSTGRWRYIETFNESDVWPLHMLRVVAQLAGLVQKRQGYFRATRKGQALCQEAKAGALFELLFRTFYRTFNLSYLDHMPDCEDIQHSAAYSLCVLARHAKDWQPLKRFASRLYLPAVLETLPKSEYYSDYDVSLAQTRLIWPLERFGLLECQYEVSDTGPYPFTFLKTLRKTPLFDRFLLFEF